LWLEEPTGWKRFAVYVLESNLTQNIHSKTYCPTEVPSFHTPAIAAVAPPCAFYHIVFITKWLSVPLNAIIYQFGHQHQSHHVSTAATIDTANTITTTATTITTISPFPIA
jgi:ABC-type sugar transport system permease subunit